jgi:ketosteroid isomerase-like protein
MSDVDPDRQRALRDLYDAFNRRDIPVLLAAMTPDVVWPNGWEGGVVRGHDEVRDYWTRQWAQIDAIVTPEGFSTQPDGRIDVTVRQVVRTLDGELLEDATVHHVYRLRDDQVAHMEIRR